MAGITLAQAEAKLATWLAAEDTLALGKIAEVNGRRIHREDLDAVRRNIQYWERQVKRLDRGGSVRARRLVVYD